MAMRNNKRDPRKLSLGIVDSVIAIGILALGVVLALQF